MTCGRTGRRRLRGDGRRPPARVDSLLPQLVGRLVAAAAGRGIDDGGERAVRARIVGKLRRVEHVLELVPARQHARGLAQIAARQLEHGLPRLLVHARADIGRDRVRELVQHGAVEALDHAARLARPRARVEFLDRQAGGEPDHLGVPGVVVGAAPVVVIEAQAQRRRGHGVAQRVGDGPGVLGQGHRPADPAPRLHVQYRGHFGPERAAVVRVRDLGLEGVPVADEDAAGLQRRGVAHDVGLMDLSARGPMPPRARSMAERRARKRRAWW